MGMSLLCRKCVFAHMAGRNVPEAKQQVEELGRVISVLVLSPSHSSEQVHGSLNGSLASPAPSTASPSCPHPSSGAR